MPILIAILAACSEYALGGKRDPLAAGRAGGTCPRGRVRLRQRPRRGVLSPSFEGRRTVGRRRRFRPSGARGVLRASQKEGLRGSSAGGRLAMSVGVVIALGLSCSTVETTEVQLERPGKSPLGVRECDELDELRRIYEADQEDRRPPVAWDVVGPRDREREERVRWLISEQYLCAPSDYRRAAMILHHGLTVRDSVAAVELAEAAVHMGDDRSRWLAAAARDRLLVRTGRPQHFGTQQGEPLDGTATNEERALWSVPIAPAP